MSLLKKCPFCGKVSDSDDCDTVYPTGTGWIDNDRFDSGADRIYVKYDKVPKEQWCYQVVCNTSQGGCGAIVEGDSKEEAIALWEKRADANSDYRLTNKGSVLVLDNNHYLEITDDAPFGNKCLLINKSAGVASIGFLKRKDTFHTHYFPLPTFKD